MNIKITIFLISIIPIFATAMRTEHLTAQKEEIVQPETINNFIAHCQSSVAEHFDKIKEGSLGKEYQDNLNSVLSTKNSIIKKSLINNQLTAAHQEINALVNETEKQQKAQPYITRIQKIISSGTKFQ